MSNCDYPNLMSLFNNDELNTQTNRPPELTVLSFGGGQDSTALLYKYVYDIEFRKKYAPGKFLVVMSNTGDEHDETYEHVEEIKQFCLKHKIEFVFITSEMGYHPNNWHSLQNHHEYYKAVYSKAFPKQCSDKLKITPIYNYLEQYLAENYDVASNRKVGYKQFAKRYGKIHVLIGIAKGEEKRISYDENSTEPQFKDAWRNMAIHIRYPLIDLEMGRSECQNYISSLGHKVPMPSNCMRCPWLSLEELLWLYRFRKDKFDEWVEYEKIKLDSFVDLKEKNLGVWGKYIKEEGRPFTLLDALAEAQEKFGDWSDEKLQDYKMSHGHCVASKY